MSAPSYPFHSLLLKLPNKRMDFPFPPLKLPNKGMEEYFKMILFIPFHSLLPNEVSDKSVCRKKFKLLVSNKFVTIVTFVVERSCYPCFCPCGISILISIKRALVHLSPPPLPKLNQIQLWVPEMGLMCHTNPPRLPISSHLMLFYDQALIFL